MQSRVALLAAMSSTLLSFVQGQTIPEINARYGPSPAPFKLEVDPSFIQETKLKVSLARIANDIGVPNFVDGPSTNTAQTTKDFWVNEFNWDAVQDEINQKYAYHYFISF